MSLMASQSRRHLLPILFIALLQCIISIYALEIAIDADGQQQALGVLSSASSNTPYFSHPAPDSSKSSPAARLALKETHPSNTGFPLLTYLPIFGDERDLSVGGKRCYTKLPNGKSKRTPCPTVPVQDKDEDWSIRRHMSNRLNYLELRGESEIFSPHLLWIKVGLPQVGEGKDWPLTRYARLIPGQKVNRFPLFSTELNRKDTFADSYFAMRERYGEALWGLNHPITYNFPRDLSKLQTDAQKEPSTRWILKPVFGGRGMGIELITNVSSIPVISNPGEWLVQKYIPNPFLVDGHPYKHSLRLYVLVTSVDPFRVYIHRNGVAKFATGEFSDSEEDHNNGKKTSHITNQALNSGTTSFAYSSDVNVDDIGSRWSLKGYFRRLRRQGIDADMVWARIRDAVLKSLLSVRDKIVDGERAHLKHRNLCFQLLGVDVDLDSNLNAWFIEANVNPSLGGSLSAFDNSNKMELMEDVFGMTGVVDFDIDSWRESLRESIVQRTIAEKNISMPVNDAHSFVEDLVAFEVEKHMAGEFESLYPASNPEETHFYQQFLQETERDAVLRQYIGH